MPTHCAPGEERPLTPGETALVLSVFGRTVDCDAVRIRRWRWFPFQPLRTVMAPCGHIHFHPRANFYRDDFAQTDLEWQGFFLHEMTHVWQAQRLGRFYLPLHRHPWCRYDYTLKPGWPLDRYGLEQQAEIVRHAFLLGQGVHVPGAPALSAYRDALAFTTDGQAFA